MSSFRLKESLSVSPLLGESDSVVTDISWSIPSSTKSKYSSVASGIMTRSEMVPTIEYEKKMREERPTAVFCYVFFLIFSPFVFRYAFASYISDTTEFIKTVKTGNGTINATIHWSDCKSCTENPGIALSSMNVTLRNVVSPANDGPFPSIAIFASYDLKQW